MLKIYGIKNCNSVKKALDKLEEKKIEFEFIDYKKNQANKELIEDFIKIFGLEKVLNKKGTSWRKLSPDEQKLAEDEKEAVRFMVENNSLIKRPVILGDGVEIIGFKEEDYLEV